MLLALISAVGFFAIFLLVKWQYFHQFRVESHSGATFWIVTAAMVANTILVTIWLMTHQEGGKLLQAILVSNLSMACLFVLYMPFYYTIATSLSVRSLIFIASRREATTLSVLLATFASEDIVRKRMQLMAHNRYLFKDDEGFRLTRRGLFVARVFTCLKRLWSLGPGG
ncbi:MAG: hypothetical protein EWM73_03637 [Nitrospira sp.]|nr:MAG: hypothetical protein EWM73_03637 [Nitrospira sp.]